VAGLSVLLTGLAFGYQSTLNFGALTTDRAYEERVSFGGPVGSGNPSGPFSQVRSEVLVPVDYGRLIAVTPLAGTGSAVFWYESQDGAVRNVMMNAANPVVIYRKGSLN
jgi:hypothetical protein